MILNKLIDGYYAFKDIKTRIFTDFKELFTYANNSFNRLAYQSNGLVGVYRDLIIDRNNIVKKMYNIKEDFNSLDSILRNESQRFTRNSYNNLSKKTLNKIIDITNRYKNSSLERVQEVINEETGSKIDSIESLLRDVMVKKTIDPEYATLKPMYYDSRIAPKDMRNEMVKLYTRSEMSLKEASLYLEKKYGMHISSSTLSKYSRKTMESKGLKFSNRRETREYYLK
jgi:hypothetical protein